MTSWVHNHDQVQLRQVCSACQGTGMTSGSVTEEAISDDTGETQASDLEASRVADTDLSGPCEQCHGDKFVYRWVQINQVARFVMEEMARQARAVPRQNF